jgi:hypothetical protein
MKLISFLTILLITCTSEVKKLSAYHDLYEPLCDHCEYRLADIFQLDGDYCLQHF